MLVFQVVIWWAHHKEPEATLVHLGIYMFILLKHHPAASVIYRLFRPPITNSQIIRNRLLIDLKRRPYVSACVILGAIRHADFFDFEVAFILDQR